MRKIMLLIVAILLSVQVNHAQTTFPLTVALHWAPNFAVDAVTKYTYVLNSATPVDVLPTVCSATDCVTKFTITQATNTVTLTATNQWGTSSPASLTFIAGAPRTPINLQIGIN